jgi:hypothetical protein
MVASATISQDRYTRVLSWMAAFPEIDFFLSESVGYQYEMIQNGGKCLLAKRSMKKFSYSYLGENLTFLSPFFTGSVFPGSSYVQRVNTSGAVFTSEWTISNDGGKHVVTLNKHELKYVR